MNNVAATNIVKYDNISRNCSENDLVNLNCKQPVSIMVKQTSHDEVHSKEIIITESIVDEDDGDNNDDAFVKAYVSKDSNYKSNHLRNSNSRTLLSTFKRNFSTKDFSNTAAKFLKDTGKETSRNTISDRAFENDLRNVAIRSKSLENHHRHAANNKTPERRPFTKLKLKTKLFRSLNSLDKPNSCTALRFEKEELEYPNSKHNEYHSLPLPKNKPIKRIINQTKKQKSDNFSNVFPFKVSNSEISTHEITPKSATQTTSSVTISPAAPASLQVDTVVSEIIPSNQLDVVDGVSVSDIQKNKLQAEQLKQKIIKTSEALKSEQAVRDDNVKEYLSLATSADKQQTIRIKNVFEKKNQKSNATIQQLQKKLDNYHKKLKELDSGSGKQGKIRDVGTNLREISGGVVDSFKHVTQNAAGAIVNKPKEMANKIIGRFGSSDNLDSLKDPEVNLDDNYPYSGDDVSSTSGSIENNTSYVSDAMYQDDRHSFDSPTCFRNKLEDKIDNSQQLQSIASQLLDIKNEMQKIRERQIELQKDYLSNKDDLQLLLTRQLEEERLRHEIQLNDLSEMHQREITYMKQELISMEEKMEYHAHERARDMQEALESCQTRIAKMEVQQHQQSVSVEGLENATARALMGKLINLLLSVMAVLLVLVSTLSGILMPFIKSQGRVFVTVIVSIISIIIYRNWESFQAWCSLLEAS